jgi:hypothetical protein
VAKRKEEKQAEMAKIYIENQNKAPKTTKPVAVESDDEVVYVKKKKKATKKIVYIDDSSDEEAEQVPVVRINREKPLPPPPPPQPEKEDYTIYFA